MFAQLDLFDRFDLLSDRSSSEVIQLVADCLEEIDPDCILIKPEDNSSVFIPERDFSDCDLLLLHQAVFDEAMNILGRQYRDNETKDTKKIFTPVAQSLSEVIEWVFAPDVVNGVRAVEIPFTFQACCALLGVSSERQIDAILDEIKVCRNMHLLLKYGFIDFLSENSRADVLKAAKGYGAMKSFELRYRPVLDDDFED